MDLFGGMIGGLLGSGLGGIFDNAWMEEDRNQQQEWSRGMNKAQRDWMERMSNSAYQRSTADMMKAGLNPMLAYHQGGASTPQSGTPSTGSGRSPGVAGGMAGAFNSAIHAKAVESQVQLNQATADREAATADRERASADEIRGAKIPERLQNIERMRQEIKESVERIEKLRQDVLTGRSSAAHLDQQVRNLQESIPQIRATTDQLKALTKLNEAQAIERLAAAGLSREQAKEVIQRVSQNLPQMERAIMDLERIAKQMQQPGLMADEAAKSSFVGQLGAYLKALLPIEGLIGALPMGRGARATTTQGPIHKGTGGNPSIHRR